MKYKNRNMYTGSQTIHPFYKEEFHRCCQSQVWMRIKTEMYQDGDYVYFVLQEGKTEIIRKVTIKAINSQKFCLVSAVADLIIQDLQEIIRKEMLAIDIFMQEKQE